MEIKLKQYYEDALTVTVEPGLMDIEFEFFDKEKVYEGCLPLLFYRGRQFSISCQCLSCGEEMKIEEKHFYIKGQSIFSYQKIEHKSKVFMDAALPIFNKLSLSNHGNYILLGGGIAKFFYQKCSHCNAQYLASYDYKYGEPPERTYPAKPADFYIEKMAWVELDEDELMEWVEK